MFNSIHAKSFAVIENNGVVILATESPEALASLAMDLVNLVIHNAAKGTKYTRLIRSVNGANPTEEDIKAAIEAADGELSGRDTTLPILYGY